jgi:large subunit ribosomal protein L25
MKLTVTQRTQLKKSDTKQIRREGNVPAVVYAPGKPCAPITLSGGEFSAILRGVQQGALPTTVFVLADGKQERRALIKDIQYNVTTYAVTHVDFVELADAVPVRVKVPIRCVNAALCAGVKLGGVLRQVIRSLEVECVPARLPAEFFIDVSGLSIGQSKRLSDMTLPEGVRPLARLEEVVVTVAKR